MSVPIVRGRRFFPLDERLQLRADHWSEGAARVATRHGLQSSSFAAAAETYRDAVGGPMSGSSVRRITEGFGEQLVQHKQAEAQRASATAWIGESPRARRVALQDPVQGQANVSSDGVMLLIRDEGWKEVKLVTISQVTLLEAGDERRRRAQREGKRQEETVVRLSQHSYCAGLWNADGFETYQYAEGLRRGLDLVSRLSSVNDGAVWIERVTQTNFPQAVQIVDWSHALQRLWGVANTVYGEGPRAAHWVEHREKALWDGKVAQVIKALDDLDLDQGSYPDLVRQTPGYFRNNRERMRYDRFRVAGYPIGSGTVESGAKNVVQHRMRRPGRGWNRDTGQAMLTPLCELYSGRFQSAWNRVGQRAPSHPKS
jgi:hypothetical protein